VSYSTRWNERNAVASTAKENLLYEYDAKWQHDVHTWFINKFGQNEFDKLHALWHQTTKFTNDDFKQMIELYKNKLKELQNEL
jgi:hypothetical protein